MLRLRPLVPARIAVHACMRGSGEEREYRGKGAPTPRPLFLDFVVRAAGAAVMPLRSPFSGFGRAPLRAPLYGRSTLCDHIITLCFSCTLACLLTYPAIQLSCLE
jgi:hypothetical protein